MLKSLLQFEFGFLNSSFPWKHFQVQKLVASPKTSPAQSSSGIGTASPRALSPNVDREGDFDTLEADRNSTKSPTSTLDSRFGILGPYICVPKWHFEPKLSARNSGTVPKLSARNDISALR